jgi:hypothetical protein
VRERLGAIVTCLLFALPFGGGGAFTGYLAGSMVYDGYRARDWVKVKAEVVSEDAYRYVYDGRSRVGTRLGLMRIGSDSLDGWTDGIVEALDNARKENRPITVYVNPEDPDEALVDRAIHWKFVVAMIPFALGFGGVGAAALWILALNIRAIASRRKGGVSVGSPGPVAMLWLFAFFWNVLSFPIAIVALPDMIADGEWVGLVILVFPAVGVLLLWAALAGSWRRLKEKPKGGRAPMSRNRRARAG